jgi:cytochrome P450
MRTRFPTGGAVTLAELAADPYPVYTRLRAAEPVSYLPALGMWYATRYVDVRAMLHDPRFVTDWPGSPIEATFGRQMLTCEGADHRRFRSAAQPAFMPSGIRAHLEVAMAQAAASLVKGFADKGTTELRQNFAARLPVQTMLLALGLPLANEHDVRRWFDIFERSLANFAGDAALAAAGRDAALAFDAFLAANLVRNSSPLHERLVEMLTPAEVRRNLSIIFFGGISTVEALILNTLWALAKHPSVAIRLAADPAILLRVIDETVRWLGPVQSATRHVAEDLVWNGVPLAAGDTVNCMIAAANHDPAMFPNPESFDIDRRNLTAHLGFAAGHHMCIGFRLARLEAAVAVANLLDLPNFHIMTDDHPGPHGYEFRQPRTLWAAWHA